MISLGYDDLIILVTAAISTLGYSILFRLKPVRLPFAVLGGFLASLVYLIMKDLVDNEFLANFVAATVVSTYSELCAYYLKAPTTVFLAPSNIPLVPGGALYWAMDSLMRGNMEAFLEYGSTASLTALGIASGIISVSLAFVGIRRIISRTKKRSGQ